MRVSVHVGLLTHACPSGHLKTSTEDNKDVVFFLRELIHASMHERPFKSLDLSCSKGENLWFRGT